MRGERNEVEVRKMTSEGNERVGLKRRYEGRRHKLLLSTAQTASKYCKFDSWILHLSECCVYVFIHACMLL